MIAQVVLELAQSFVFLVADAVDGDVQFGADIGNRPASHPEFENPVLPARKHGGPGGLQNFTELESIALTFIVTGRGDGKSINRLMPLGTLNPLANHVDRSHQLAAFGGVVGENLSEIKLPFAGLAEKTTANFLSAIIPDCRVQACITPTDGAIALDVAHQLGFRRLRRERRQADDQCHGRRGRFSGS